MDEDGLLLSRGGFGLRLGLWLCSMPTDIRVGLGLCPMPTDICDD